MQRKRVIKKNAFIEMLGKETFKQWSEHTKRKLIDPDAAVRFEDTTTAKTLLTLHHA